MFIKIANQQFWMSQIFILKFSGADGEYLSTQILVTALLWTIGMHKIAFPMTRFKRLLGQGFLSVQYMVCVLPNNQKKQENRKNKMLFTNKQIPIKKICFVGLYQVWCDVIKQYMLIKFGTIVDTFTLTYWYTVEIE